MIPLRMNKENGFVPSMNGGGMESNMKFVSSRRIRNLFPGYIENYFSYQSAFSQILSMISDSKYDCVLNLGNAKDGDITPVNVVSALAGHQIATEQDPFYPLIAHCRAFSREDLLRNPYYRDIRLEGCELGDFRVASVVDRQFEVVLWNEVVCEKCGGLDSFVPCIGFWKDEPAPYYILQDKEGNGWMAVTFNEIFTMQPAVDEAKGRVLTLGLGLGYYAYMAALKPEVESVTVVERNEGVIEFFKQKILPQFGEAGEKIRVVQADAFEFMPAVKDGEYDFCFADIWNGLQEEKPFYALRNLCGSSFRGMKMAYWLENSFLGQVATGVKAVLMEGFAEAEQERTWLQLAISAKQLRDSGKYEFFAVADKLMQDVVIRTMEDIEYYWEFANIKKLCE